MNFDIITQNDELIEVSFFVFIDKFKEIHCGENLEIIKENLPKFYNEVFPEDNETKESFNEYVSSIKEEDLQKIEIKIKRPNYAENTSILSSSTSIDPTNGIPTIDYAEYNRQRIIKLLKDWNLERNNKKVPVSEATIGSLHPAITDYITSSINEHVQHYLTTLIN